MSTENKISTEVQQDRKQQAMQLHIQIKTSAELAATSMVEFMVRLKEMRDTKLYIEMNHASFEDYVEKDIGIKSRQAYYYISTYEQLGSKLIEDKASLGITKLRLLTEVPALDREDFLNDTDLAGMSTAEIKAAVKERNGLREQLDMFQQASTVDPAEPVEIIEPVDIEKIKQEAVAEYSRQVQAEADKKARAEMQKEIEAAKREAKKAAAEKMAKDNKQAVEKAAEDAKKETEERLKKEFEQAKTAAQQQVASAQEKAKQLESQLKIAGNQDTLRFSLLFESLQGNVNSILDIINKTKTAGEQETAEKMAGAMVQLLEAVKNQIN